MNLDWTKIGAIATVVAACITFITMLVPNAEQKEKINRKKILKSLKCDLILIPTKGWNSGAHYQHLIGELNGQNRIYEAAKYCIENSSINDYFEEDPVKKQVCENANYTAEHSIAKEWFENDQIFLLDPLELNWLDTERIYGVNIKKDKFVIDARRRLMTTQYFKNAIITTQGEKHDKQLNKPMKLNAILRYIKQKD